MSTALACSWIDSKVSIDNKVSPDSKMVSVGNRMVSVGNRRVSVGNRRVSIGHMMAWTDNLHRCSRIPRRDSVSNTIRTSSDTLIGMEMVGIVVGNT